MDKVILRFVWKGKGTRIVYKFLKRRVQWEESVYLTPDWF